MNLGLAGGRVTLPVDHMSERYHRAVRRTEWARAAWLRVYWGARIQRRARSMGTIMVPNMHREERVEYYRFYGLAAELAGNRPFWVRCQSPCCLQE